MRESLSGGGSAVLLPHTRHFFIEAGQPVYQELAKIHKLRRERLPLRRGRQFLRQISGDGRNFRFPERIGAGRMQSIVAWSRIFNENELLCAINTDPDNETSAFVTIDNDLHAAGSVLTCLYSTKATEIGQNLTVESRNGKAVSLKVPPAGFVVYGLTADRGSVFQYKNCGREQPTSQ